jgi:signal transduction histidine kinase/ActR/RegA family two-component response regulator/Flp pilus assembly protein TadD
MPVAKGYADKMSEANDSLKSQLAKATDVWERVKLLGETAFHSRDRDPRKGLDACREAIELARKAGACSREEKSILAGALSILAELHTCLHERSQALGPAFEALAIFEEIDSEKNRPMLLLTISSVYSYSGAFAEAFKYAQEALTLSQGSSRDLQTQASAWTHLGVLHNHACDFYLEKDSYQKALEIYRDLGNQRSEAIVLNNIAMSLLALGKLDDAEAFTEESLALAEAVGLPPIVATVLCTQSEILLKKGENHKSLRNLDRSIALARSSGLTPIELTGLLDKGRVLTNLERSEEALPHLEKALGLAEDIDSESSVCECHKALAEAHRRQGDHRRALAHFEQAYHIQEAISRLESDDKFRILQVLHKTETARKESEILRNENKALEQEITGRKQFEEELSEHGEHLEKMVRERTENLERANENLRKKTHDFGERVKELRCLYAVSESLRDPRSSMEKILKGLPALLIPGWQYPDITCVRISLKGKQYLTDIFRETEHQQMEEIAQQGAVEGKIEVFYLEERPDADEGPFLKEERDLLSAIAELIANFHEHKQLEEQFRQSQKMEAVGRLAGGIAHDFNNMMTIISGYADLLLTKGEVDPFRKELDEIKTAASRATRLTGQLLAFSRKQIIKPEFLDSKKLLLNLEKMLQRLIGEDIELTMALHPLVGTIWVDPGQVEQIILNLAVNARDAMPLGGKLTIEASDVFLGDEYSEKHVSVEPGPYVMIAVSDTGSGMDETVKQQAFEPFFTTKEKSKGTGLGLSTVYGIVKQNQGYIWIYSELNQGTTFKIYFPRHDSSGIEAVTVQTRVLNLAGSETILLVEDEEAVRMVAKKMLEAFDYKVIHTGDTEEALRICREHEGTIHLLLTDVVMPKMSGRQLANRVTEITPSIKVIFMSGYTDNAIAQHGVLDANTVFIEKPFTPDSLVRKVREVLDTKTG